MFYQDQMAATPCGVRSTPSLTEGVDWCEWRYECSIGVQCNLTQRGMYKVFVVVTDTNESWQPQGRGKELGLEENSLVSKHISL